MRGHHVGILLTSGAIVLLALTHVVRAIEWAKHRENDVIIGGEEEEMAMMMMGVADEHIEYICKGCEERKLKIKERRGGEGTITFYLLYNTPSGMWW